MTDPLAATFAAVFVAYFVAHQVADHWVQTGHQAATKGQRGWGGTVACAAHVGSYTVACFTALVIADWSLHLHLNDMAVLLGLAVSGTTHYWADRRYTLSWLAERAGKGEFYMLGAPRPGHDDNRSLGTGAYALDQSWHYAWLLAAALVTAVVR